MTRKDPQLPPGPQKQQAARPVRDAVFAYGNTVVKLARQLVTQERTAHSAQEGIAAAQAALTATLAAVGASLSASQLRYFNKVVWATADLWAQGTINSNQARHRWKGQVRKLVVRAERRQRGAGQGRRPAPPAREEPR